MRIFITGGCGYIGSHLALRLDLEDHDIMIYDNLSNCPEDRYDKLNEFSNASIHCEDICDGDKLTGLMLDFKPDVVYHLAAMKNSADSFNQCFRYYDKNVNGTMNVLRASTIAKVKKFIFASSAAVYGPHPVYRSSEEFTGYPKSVYGNTKLICERIIKDVSSRYGFSATCLRYFNPIGSMVNFQDYRSTALVPTLVSSIIQQKRISIYGDGSALRDYIHISDLVAASYLFAEVDEGFEIYNIGTGMGVPTIEMISAIEKVTGVKLKKKYKPPRSGDVDRSIADISKIRGRHGWFAKRSLEDGIRDEHKAEIVRLSIEHLDANV